MTLIVSSCFGRCGSPQSLQFESITPRTLQAGERIKVNVRLPLAPPSSQRLATLFVVRPGEPLENGYVATRSLNNNQETVEFDLTPYRGPGSYDVLVRLYAQEATGQVLVAEVRDAKAIEIHSKMQVVWSGAVKTITMASPTVVDVNSDGVRDVILGMGVDTQFGVTSALDGATGNHLWSLQDTDEIIASPAVAKVGSNGETFLFNGGRSGKLTAYRAHDGKPVWTREFGRWLASPAIADVLGDKRSEVIAVAGGSNFEHHPGILAVLEAETGTVLWEHREPDDGQEYYASPAVGDINGDGVLDIVIGSGGEVKTGATIAFAGTGSGFRKLWVQPTQAKGIEASPLLADANADGDVEIFTAGMEGSIAALQGSDGKVLWRREYPGFEFYPSPGIGSVSGDGSLTLAVAGSSGAFPWYNEGLLVVLDAATGAEKWTRKLGHIAGGSPLFVDIDQDNRQEIIVTMGGYHEGERGFPRTSRLLIFNGENGSILDLLELPGIAAATPVVTDLDNDGYLDILTASYLVPDLRRIATPYSAPSNPGWWKFRGNLENTGLFTPPPK